ncbi:replication protein A 70 kDa DNA-binding subunit B [Striga asiatica]|uniref:Replication protein A 70 kDa DNA-binding subunit B n=1 Tax=Striga asiatica TaxID=4170 RepID=A0A5A7PC72_STRAF|nr:replication protein A 70 kDa DNA-binding subunit B [Striga asiatica]
MAGLFSTITRATLLAPVSHRSSRATICRRENAGPDTGRERRGHNRKVYRIKGLLRVRNLASPFFFPDQMGQVQGTHMVKTSYCSFNFLASSQVNRNAVAIVHFLLSDETNNWTALIQVVERPPVQTSKNNTSTLYRRYLFTDEEGTKVSAVVYNAVINEFDELLMPYKRYYLSGAKVRPEVPLYQVSDYKYNWLIVSGTNVEEYQESLPPQLPCHIDIHTFADIHKYADTDNPRSE